MTRPKATEMKPRSAPENGAFEPLSSSRIAGTEPAPMKTSSAVPMNSANRRCETWCSAISPNLLPAQGREAAGRSAEIPEASLPGNDIRHDRTAFDDDRTRRPLVSSAARRKATSIEQRQRGANPADSLRDPLLVLDE